MNGQVRIRFLDIDCPKNGPTVISGKDIDIRVSWDLAYLSIKCRCGETHEIADYELEELNDM